MSKGEMSIQVTDYGVASNFDGQPLELLRLYGILGYCLRARLREELWKNIPTTVLFAAIDAATAEMASHKKEAGYQEIVVDKGKISRGKG